MLSGKKDANCRRNKHPSFSPSAVSWLLCSSPKPWTRLTVWDRPRFCGIIAAFRERCCRCLASLATHWSGKKGVQVARRVGAGRVDAGRNVDLPLHLSVRWGCWRACLDTRGHPWPGIPFTQWVVKSRWKAMWGMAARSRSLCRSSRHRRNVCEETAGADCGG